MQDFKFRAINNRPYKPCNILIPLLGSALSLCESGTSCQFAKGKPPKVARSDGVVTDNTKTLRLRLRVTAKVKFNAKPS